MLNDLMKVPVTVRQAIKNMLGPEVIRYVRHLGTPKVRDPKTYLQPLAGKRALEIGGPSEIFDYDGSVPVYPVLGSVDNCVFSHETMWTGKVDSCFHYNARRRQGVQYICDATKLDPIADISYECILSSHCLEHLANPLKALAEIRRVLKPGGFFLAILPHKDNTFDWRRPLTPLSHIQEDYARDTRENDMSHLPEVLALHDATRDKFPGAPEQLLERLHQNQKFRIMHHHTFNPTSAAALIELAGFKILQVETVKPYHIVILALH